MPDWIRYYGSVIKDLDSNTVFERSTSSKKEIVLACLNLVPLFWRQSTAKAVSFQLEIGCFVGKIEHSSTQSKLYFDQIKSSWKLMISFCVLQKKFELDFGCGLCWPCFCQNMFLNFKIIIFKGFYRFLSELKDYNMRYVNINWISWHFSIKISKEIQISWSHLIKLA